MNGETRYCKYFGENFRKFLLTNSIHFVTDGSFTSDGGLLSPTGGFKQALSTLQKLNERKKQELKEINNGHRVLLLHGGVGKILGGLLILMKVTMEMNQVLIKQGDLFLQVFGTILQGMNSLNSFTLLQMDRLQLTSVYCNRWRV